MCNALQGNPDQGKRFTIRSGLLTGNDTRRLSAVRPLPERTDFGPRSLQLYRQTRYDTVCPARDGVTLYRNNATINAHVKTQNRVKHLVGPDPTKISDPMSDPATRFYMAPSWGKLRSNTAVSSLMFIFIFFYHLW